MKLTIEIDLDTREMAQICQNSIERVMNNAINVGEFAQKRFQGSYSSMSDAASTLWQDCEELKELNTKLWNAVRDQIFKDRLR